MVVMTVTKTLAPHFFELTDIRVVQGRSWIPLRLDQEVERESPFQGVGGIREYSGVASLAVLEADRAVVDGFTWSDVDQSTHDRSFDGGLYRPADVHCDWSPERNIVGVRLVLAQAMGGFDSETWHLHQDLVIALKLVREGDVWFRPDEGWADVARLRRNEEDRRVLLEMRAEMLSDYLAARGMALFLSSYHERAAYFAEKPPYPWVDEHREWSSDRDQHEAYITEAEFSPEPEFSFRGLGALWRKEWFEPGNRSIRVRGDADPDEVTFAVGPSGERKTAGQCIGAMTYLAFKPTLVPALLHFRSGRLGWYTGDTGAIAAADTGIHFGINALGLVTIFAKDIANLDGWEQRAWAAHSTPLDGGASRELLDAQMNCKPADTVAPETQILAALGTLDSAFQARYGAPLLRENGAVDSILRRTHRFRAVEHDGLLALSKELNRLLMERVDIDLLRGPASIPPKEKIGSLKALERLIEQSIGQSDAKTMMAPLFGINDLRNADSHLGSSLAESGFERARVDREVALVEQGRQLIATFVKTLCDISTAIDQGGVGV